MRESVTEAVAPPKTSAARGTYTEQLHFLVDAQTREYVIGVAAEIAEEAGYKYVRQGEVIRELVAEAILARYDRANGPELYTHAVRAGRAVIAGSAGSALLRRA